MQQLLIPYASGDECLSIPGWAGELSEEELAFVQERLRRCRMLLRLWKIATGDGRENASLPVKVVLSVYHVYVDILTFELNKV